jgi:hypothetical protein
LGRAPRFARGDGPLVTSAFTLAAKHVGRDSMGFGDAPIALVKKLGL